MCLPRIIFRAFLLLFISKILQADKEHCFFELKGDKECQSIIEKITFFENIEKTKI